MLIEKAPNQLLYADPRRFMTSNILPIRMTCSFCGSRLILEMESDIYANREKGWWGLAFDCMVCGKRCHIVPPKPDVEAEAKKLFSEHGNLTEGQYIQKVHEKEEERKLLRHRFENDHTFSERRVARSDWLNNHAYSAGQDEYMRLVETKYLPPILPEVNGALVAHYSTVLEYYKNKATIREYFKPSSYKLEWVYAVAFVFILSVSVGIAFVAGLVTFVTAVLFAAACAVVVALLLDVKGT